MGANRKVPLAFMTAGGWFSGRLLSEPGYLPCMEITLSMVEGIPVMSLAGRLDVTTSPLLEERLLPAIESDGAKIILDCSELSYVSSAGLRVFITCQRRLAEHGGGLAFAALSKPVLELFRLAGLETLFVIAATPAEAVARLS